VVCIFLIGHINVNKGVFCLIISYLQIKSYNVLNYNHCSTDWPFPLNIFFLIIFFLVMCLCKDGRCGPHGVCLINPEDNSPECKCMTGYTGSYCQEGN
jgi:uncharacterized membrane protein